MLRVCLAGVQSPHPPVSSAAERLLRARPVQGAGGRTVRSLPGGRDVLVWEMGDQ